MESLQLQEFASRLKEQRDEIIEKRSHQQDELMIRKEDLMDETDMSRIELEHGMHIRLRSRENVFLRKIESALSRIQHGTFGFCGECEEEIEVSRLHARPTTTLCIPCKEAEERKERGYIGESQEVALKGFYKVIHSA